MCSYDFITPGVNRSDGGPQPTRRGAAPIQRNSGCLPGDPDIVVARVNRFGIVDRSSSHGIHFLSPGLKLSGNYKALLSAKLNQVRLDGEPHKPSGLAFTATVVNARYELTKPECFFPVMGFHGLKCNPGNRAVL
jgi:hypothetical protein